VPLNATKLWQFLSGYDIVWPPHFVFLVREDVAVEDIAELLAGMHWGK
jgi:hypothetical protein